MYYWMFDPKPGRRDKIADNNTIYYNIYNIMFIVMIT